MIFKHCDTTSKIACIIKGSKEGFALYLHHNILQGSFFTIRMHYIWKELFYAQQMCIKTLAIKKTNFFLTILTVVTRLSLLKEPLYHSKNDLLMLVLLLAK